MLHRNLVRHGYSSQAPSVLTVWAHYHCSYLLMALAPGLVSKSYSGPQLSLDSRTIQTRQTTSPIISFKLAIIDVPLKYNPSLSPFYPSELKIAAGGKEASTWETKNGAQVITNVGRYFSARKPEKNQAGVNEMLLLLLEWMALEFFCSCTLSLQLLLCSSFRQVSMFLVQGAHPLSQMNYLKCLRHFNISCQMHKTSLTSDGSESDVPWR